MNHELRKLCVERQRLMLLLSRVIGRVGPHHPRRAAVNKERAKHRKRFRAALRKNERMITALVMQQFTGDTAHA